MDNNIEKILVVGAGTMGHGIAQSFAMAGYNISLYSRTTQTLDRAKELINSSLHTLAQEKMLCQEEIPAILGRIRTTNILEEGADHADIVFENIAENADAKQKLFGMLDSLCRPETLFASNTTALNVFECVKISHPERFLIAHWYAPPQLMPLVDIVKGPETSPENIQVMVQMLKNMGKVPLVFKKFVSGYVISRMQIALLREIFFLLDHDYVLPEELDKAAKNGLALRMMVLGIAQRMDFTGLDITVKMLDDPYVQSQMVALDYKPRKIYELVEAGHLGVKTGKGFYEYSGRSEAELCYERDIKLIRILKAYREIEGNLS